MKKKSRRGLKIKILMVVSDIQFPYISGGARRTLETARILKKMGNEIYIFSNKREDQTRFEIIEGFKVYRRKMIEPGIIIRKILSGFTGKFLNRIRKSINKQKSENKEDQAVFTAPIKSRFDSHLEINKAPSIRTKIKELYRHKFPIHKIFKNIRGLPTVLRIIKEEKIDVIYERGPSYGLGVFAAKLTNRISIVDFIDVMYWDWALKHCDRILSYFTTFQVPGFIPREKIDTVYMTVDEDVFKPLEGNGEFLRKKFHIGADKVIGMYVGGFYNWHGLEYLVKAVHLLKNDSSQSQVLQNLKIVMVGFGDLFVFIKNLVKKLQLEDYFIFTGRVNFDEVPNYIGSTDFCLSLNTGDSFGLKIFEYLSCGKPLIAADVDIISHYLEDGKQVVLVKSGDIKDVADKIVDIINDPEKRKIIGQNARKLVETKYTWKKHGKTIIYSVLKSIKKRRNEM